MMYAQHTAMDHETERETDVLQRGSQLEAV